jgi:quercetin dioxygenase-like cupin family protein
MIQKAYGFALSDNRNIEKLVDDDQLMINHMVLPEGEGLPEHYSNSNVYMIVIRGIMTLKLDEQEPNLYTHGQIINIPFNTKMNVNNFNKEVLEFFVIKVPNPKNYRGI